MKKRNTGKATMREFVAKDGTMNKSAILNYLNQRANAVMKREKRKSV